MAPKLVVAVLDTSVLYGNTSRRVLTIRWLRTNGFDPSSLNDLSRASKDMMDVLSAALTLVDTSPTAGESLITMNDADDFHLVRAARLAGAGFVVSANTRDFPPPNARGQYLFEDTEFNEYGPFLARLNADDTTV